MSRHKPAGGDKPAKRAKPAGYVASPSASFRAASSAATPAGIDSHTSAICAMLIELVSLGKIALAQQARWLSRVTYNQLVTRLTAHLLQFGTSQPVLGTVAVRDVQASAHVIRLGELLRASTGTCSLARYPGPTGRSARSSCHNCQIQRERLARKSAGWSTSAKSRRLVTLRKPPNLCKLATHRAWLVAGQLLEVHRQR